MSSPAKAHYLRHIAAAEAAKAAPDAPMENATGYELMLAKLAQDKRRLKELQSVERKIEVKRTLLPDYAPWVEGVLSAGRGAQDDVLMTVLVWRIDVGDFAGALAIARYALHFGLQLPDQYQRTLPCLLAEEVADTALKATDAGLPVDLDSLDQVAQLTADEDMPDEVRAKLYKAGGYAMRDTDKPTALRLLQRALQLHDKVGVKKDIEHLEREIRNAAAAAGAPDEGKNATDAAKGDG
jgi:hypothetical protein